MLLLTATHVPQWMAPILFAKIQCRQLTKNSRGDAWCQRRITLADFPPISASKWLGLPVQKHRLFIETFYSVNTNFFLVATGETLVVRTCVLEDMNSQCGSFKFQNDTLKGCLLTCNFDGCNSAPNLQILPNFVIFLSILYNSLI